MPACTPGAAAHQIDARALDWVQSVKSQWNERTQMRLKTWEESLSTCARGFGQDSSTHACTTRRRDCMSEQTLYHACISYGHGTSMCLSARSVCVLTLRGKTHRNLMFSTCAATPCPFALGASGPSLLQHEKFYPGLSKRQK
eukprot:1151260-Pelagomonas_calceolata.AAC.3